MKKIISLFLAALMTMMMFTGCKKEAEVELAEYEGILTKVRLGMTMDKVIGLNSGSEIYYDSDTELWVVNNDTDLKEIDTLIPEDNQFYYTDDSLITYLFRQEKSDNEFYLTGYLEELRCKLDRENSLNYYETKKSKLIEKYKADETTVATTMTGTEGVDMTLVYKTVMTLSSFEVTFTMQLTWDMVDGVEDYYGSYYCIEIDELKTKTPVEVKSDKK